jgi:histidine triad (HIT) family protein
VVGHAGGWSSAGAKGSERAVAGGHDGAVNDPEPVLGCAFCQIVAGDVPADLVFVDDVAVAFLDRSPLFHGHTLVVPVRHVVTLGELTAEETGPFWRRVAHISRVMPSALGAEGTFVANNNVVSQSVAHLHVHVVPRVKGDGMRGFFWPRTKYGEGESAGFARLLRTELERFDG